jgi:hypothetical protein
MDRRLGLWVSAVGGLLAVALVAAPIWDLWRYRRLRAPLGAHVPVGMILPLRTLPAPLPTRPAAAEEIPAAAPLQPPPADRPTRSDAPGGIAAAPAPPIAAPDHAAGNAPDRPGPHRDFTSRLRDNAVAATPLSSHTGAATTTDDATSKSTTADTGAEPSAAAGALLVWPAAPAPDHGPQLPPEPQQGPPPPSPTTPTHSTGDPRPATVAIPMLTLVPPAGPVAVGDSFTIAVRLSGASNVTSLPFHVEFDPAVLQFQSAEQGPAIAAGMQPILLASVNPARPGDLAVGLSLIESGGLLHGTGTVIRLQFRALAAGTSPLGFSSASIRGAISETLDAQFHDASVNVR